MFDHYSDSLLTTVKLEGAVEELGNYSSEYLMAK